MASSGLYKVITASDADLDLQPGYFKAWINTRSDFTTLNEPAALDEDSVAGDSFIIASAHTWVSGKGAIPCFINKDTLQVNGESNGEIGTQRMIWRPEILMLGDSAPLLENITNWLNEDLIIFVQDGCGADEQIIQFGCDCYPAKVEKQTFASAQLTSGQKGYTMTARGLCKFFYNAALTVRS